MYSVISTNIMQVCICIYIYIYSCDVCFGVYIHVHIDIHICMIMHVYMLIHRLTVVCLKLKPRRIFKYVLSLSLFITCIYIYMYTHGSLCTCAYLYTGIDLCADKMDAHRAHLAIEPRRRCNSSGLGCLAVWSCLYLS